MAEHAHIFLLLTILGLVTILIVFGMKYFSGARQAGFRFASEGGYRELAERVSANQAATATSLAAVQADLLEMRTKLNAINKVLREVE
jgi:hypothetical protein